MERAIHALFPRKRRSKKPRFWGIASRCILRRQTCSTVCELRHDPAATPRIKKTGDTYSRTFGTTIGSESLTAVFGMGTGVTFQICSPEILVAAFSGSKKLW